MQDMIVERGVITSVAEQTITVSCRSRIDCIRCAEGKGCGGGILARWLGDRQFQVQAYFYTQTQSPQKGEMVEIAIPSSRLVNLAATMYGLPLVILDIALIVQVQLFPAANDLTSILVAGVSLVAGFKASAYMIKQANKKGQLLPKLQQNDLTTAIEMASCRKAEKNT